MKRSVLAIILAGLVLLTGFGAVVLSLSRPAPVDARAMTAANALVAAGHYAEAAQMYEQLITQGAQDAALYYNLGNVALSMGDAGRAAAAYERAAALAPRDADIRANLAVARQQTRGPVNPATGQQQTRGQSNLPVAQQARGPVSTRSAGPLGSLADATGHWLTIDELALLALAAWLALGLLVFGYRTLQPERRPALLRVGLAAALVVVLATGAGLAGRMAASRLAAPATIAGQKVTRQDG
jgi:tetratricopeptide (TPR) repeat protein